MLNKSIIVRLGVLFSICLPAARAFGVDNTFQPPGSTGWWHMASNWSQGHVPNAAETVVIPSGRTCILADTAGVADNLSLFGELRIEGCSLTLDGSGSALHWLAGELVLVSSQSSVRFIDRNHFLTGFGGIEGLREGARFEDDGQGRVLFFLSGFGLAGWLDFDLRVSTSAILAMDGDFQFKQALANGGVIQNEGALTFEGPVTNSGTIEGGSSLTFGGPVTNSGGIAGGSLFTIDSTLHNGGGVLVGGEGHFNGAVTNNGSIEIDGTCEFNAAADNDGLIEVGGQLQFDASVSGSGLFSVAGGVMTFSAGSSATHLLGDFHVTAGGEVHVNANVHTSGSLKAFSGSGSKFIVAAGKSIRFK
jgi:hypothetical protein